MYNENTYVPFTFCKNLKPEKNLVLKLQQKMLLANQITIFFNCQYLITDFYFLHVDRHEWKKNGLLMISLKILSRDKSTNLKYAANLQENNHTEVRLQ